MATLFDQIVESSGLSAMFAARTIERALTRSSVIAPRSVSVVELRRAIPAIEESLKVYLEPDECDRRMKLITELAR